MAAIIICPAAAQEWATSTGQAVKVYASSKGAPGTPEYTAALRDAISSAADALRTGKGDYDRSRAISPSQIKTGVVVSPVLAIDSDKDYQSWLSEAAETPIIDIDISGRPPIIVRSIGGEKLVGSDLFPEVGLTLQLPNTGYCSGVMIDRQTLLTAGHCVCPFKPEHVVVFGSSRGRSSFKIKAVRTRETISCNNVWHAVRGRDVAVIRLASPVPESLAPSAAIADEELIHREFGRKNRRLFTVGFGYMEPGGSTNDKNLSVVPILSPDCSRVGDESIYGCAKGREILTKSPRLVGPCEGDSGGGAYIVAESTVNGKQLKQLWLVGLVSRSTLNARVPCGDGAIFTLLTKETVDWARNTATELAH